MLFRSSADIFLSISEAFFDFSLSSCFSTVSSISHPARSIHKNRIFPFCYPQFLLRAFSFCGKHLPFLRTSCKTSPSLSTLYFCRVRRIFAMVIGDFLHLVKKELETGKFPVPALFFCCNLFIAVFHTPYSHPQCCPPQIPNPSSPLP